MLIEQFEYDKFDVIGDIHGEYTLLVNLMEQLGYDRDGVHPEGRKLVFVGDFVDRGEDSVATVLLVKKLVKNGLAKAVLGNHEVNILLGKEKDGNSWFFRTNKEIKRYGNMRQPTDAEKKEIVDFLIGLPVGLESDNVNICHAAWDEKSIERLRTVNKKNVVEAYAYFKKESDEFFATSGLKDDYLLAKSAMEDALLDKNKKPKFYKEIADYEALLQNSNPIKVVVSGLEEVAKDVFFVGRWRFVKRSRWWDGYSSSKKLVIGHYWRRLEKVELQQEERLFENVEFNCWHGGRKNVFCVDFSAGLNFKNRVLSENVLAKLGALRFPEEMLVFDCGKKDLIRSDRVKNKL